MQLRGRRERRTGMRSLIALLAAGALVLTGCSSSKGGAPDTAASTSASSTVSPAAATAASARIPGWADGVVAAGAGAFVLGWHHDRSAALWWVDATGRPSERVAPPRMPGERRSGPQPGVDLVFEGADTGFAITGRDGSHHHRGHHALYVTVDGARTWKRVHLPTSEQPVHVAVGDGTAYALTSNRHHATLWSVDPTGATSPHTFDNLPRMKGLDDGTSLAAFGDHVWVLLGLGAGRGVALRSDDGGRTWHRFHAGICLWQDLMATSGRVLWSACGTGMLQHFTRQVGVGAPAVVFRRDMGGTSDSALFPLTNATAYAVVAGGISGGFSVTHDGGRTTTTVAPIPKSFMRKGFTATFVSTRVGFLVTMNGGEVYRTDDGGRTWHEVEPQ